MDIEQEIFGANFSEVKDSQSLTFPTVVGNKFNQKKTNFLKRRVEIFGKTVPVFAILLGLMAMWAVPVMAAVLLSMSTHITVAEPFHTLYWNTTDTDWSENSIPGDITTVAGGWVPMFVNVQSESPRPLTYRITLTPLDGPEGDPLHDTVDFWWDSFLIPSGNPDDFKGCWEGDSYVIYTIMPQYSDRKFKIDYILNGSIDSEQDVWVTHQTERLEYSTYKQHCGGEQEMWNPEENGMDYEDFVCKNYWLFWTDGGEVPIEWGYINFSEIEHCCIFGIGSPTPTINNTFVTNGNGYDCVVAV